MASNTTPELPAQWAALERFSFGDSPAMADELLALVLAGGKRATCWDVRDGQQTHVGKHMIAADGAGVPRAVLKTIELVQRRFIDVEWSFAAAEGEGDRDLEDWRAGHRGYFERQGHFAPDMLLWCERFEVVAVL
jgi:uncharacterized protein YhfF